MRGGCGRVYRTSPGELTRPVIGRRAPAMRQAAARTVPPPATGSKPGFPARDGSNAMVNERVFRLRLGLRSLSFSLFFLFSSLPYPFSFFLSSSPLLSLSLSYAYFLLPFYLFSSAFFSFSLSLSLSLFFSFHSLSYDFYIVSPLSPKLS